MSLRFASAAQRLSRSALQQSSSLLRPQQPQQAAVLRHALPLQQPSRGMAGKAAGQHGHQAPVVVLKTWHSEDIEHEHTRHANGMLMPKSKLQQQIYKVGLVLIGIYVVYAVKFNFIDAPAFGGRNGELAMVVDKEKKGNKSHFQDEGAPQTTDKEEQAKEEAGEDDEQKSDKDH